MYKNQHQKKGVFNCFEDNLMYKHSNPLIISETSFQLLLISRLLVTSYFNIFSLIIVKNYMLTVDLKPKQDKRSLTSVTTSEYKMVTFAFRFTITKCK